MPRKHPRRKVPNEPGLYRAGDVFYACATPPGERQAVWKTIGHVGIMEARRERDRHVGRIRDGETPPPARNATVTFAQVYERWIAHRKKLCEVGELAPKTIEIAESAWRLYLQAELGRRRIATLRPEDLVDWHQNQRLLGQSAWTIKQRWGVITAVLAYAARHHAIPNVADMLERRERPKNGPTRVRYLDEKEIEQLLGATTPTYEVAIAIAMFTGLRLSELLGLGWEECDFDEEVVRVRWQMPRGRNPERTKILKTSAAHRDVVMMPALATVLKRYRLRSPHSQNEDLVLATRTGKTLGHRNLTSRGLDLACERAGLKDVTLHTLRHTFASLLIAQGRDAAFVARQLGHQDPAFTLRTYVHLFDAERQAKEARTAMDAQFGHLLRSNEGTSA